MRKNTILIAITFLVLICLGASFPNNSYVVATLFPHHQAHLGNSYRVTEVDHDLDTNEKMLLLINTNGVYPHVSISLTSSSESYAEIWTGATVSALGGVQTARNINLASNNTATTSVTNTPTITSAGTNLTELEISAGAGRKVGGSWTEDEIILNTSTLYLINAISEADNNHVSLVIKWYETTSAY